MEEKNHDMAYARSQLTKATYKVVSRKGYYNFTIKDIAKEAGFRRGWCIIISRTSRTCS